MHIISFERIKIYILLTETEVFSHCIDVIHSVFLLLEAHKRPTYEQLEIPENHYYGIYSHLRLCVYVC